MAGHGEVLDGSGTWQSPRLFCRLEVSEAVGKRMPRPQSTLPLCSHLNLKIQGARCCYGVVGIRYGEILDHVTVEVGARSTNRPVVNWPCTVGLRYWETWHRNPVCRAQQDCDLHSRVERPHAATSADVRYGLVPSRRSHVWCCSVLLSPRTKISATRWRVPHALFANSSGE